jgi:hypothetical protein
MRFRVTRTSHLGRGLTAPPCEEAVDTPTGWMVELRTLVQFREFARKYGDLVVTHDSIEIYDDYRE